MGWKSKEEKERFKIKLRKRCLELLGGRCRICGATENLNFHHKDLDGYLLNGKNGRGWWKRHYDVLHYPEKYFLLCETCHKNLHRALLEEERNED